jgi:hypothetical protein
MEVFGVFAAVDNDDYVGIEVDFDANGHCCFPLHHQQWTFQVALVSFHGQPARLVVP